MFPFDVTKWVPGFILNDKNGYAVAKAIEAGVQAMNDTIERGIQSLSDYDTMPEWRLDEIAWETNCPYDYNADIEAKRHWIKEANRFFGMYGTPDGIAQYLSGIFHDVKVEEGAEYGGEPFHFRCTFSGTWTPESVAWATDAIHAIKNVRSVLDGYKFFDMFQTSLFAGCAVYGGNHLILHLPADIPDALRWYVDEVMNTLTDEDGNLLYVEDDIV